MSEPTPPSPNSSSSTSTARSRTKPISYSHYARPPTPPSPKPLPEQDYYYFNIKPHLLINLTSIALISASLFLFPNTPLLDGPIENLTVAVPCLIVIQTVIESWRWIVLIDEEVEGWEKQRSFQGKLAMMFEKRKWHFPTAIKLTLFGAFMFHLICILFGTHLLDHVYSTFTFSLFISLLAIWPPAMAFKNHGPVWSRVFSDNSPETIPEKLVYYPTVGSVVGAWLGSIVIPLDWDRPWQAWPIPCVLGAYMGYTMGTILSLIVCYFSEESAAQKKRRQ